MRKVNIFSSNYHPINNIPPKFLIVTMFLPKLQKIVNIPPITKLPSVK